MEIWKLIVYGKVQGVFYRDSVYQFVHGHILNIKGTIRNLPNGTVEVIIQGYPDELRKVEDFCYEGSERAVVSNIEKNQLAELEDFSDFTIEY